MKAITKRLLAAAVLLLVTACETTQTTQPGVVGVDRKQHFLLSADDVNKASSLAYQDVVKQAASKNALDRDPAQVARVRGIAQRLAAASGALRAAAQQWAWEYHVVDSSEVNAWCMPGGKIAVYTGLLAKIKPTDDELAAVLGHEIAHALREHGRERASEAAVQQGLLSAGGALLGIGDAGLQLANIVANVTFGLPHSRSQEVEAD